MRRFLSTTSPSESESESASALGSFESRDAVDASSSLSASLSESLSESLSSSSSESKRDALTPSEIFSVSLFRRRILARTRSPGAKRSFRFLTKASLHSETCARPVRLLLSSVIKMP